jgi:hypothetical protein
MKHLPLLLGIAAASMNGDIENDRVPNLADDGRNYCRREANKKRRNKALGKIQRQSRKINRRRK